MTEKLKLPRWTYLVLAKNGTSRRVRVVPKLACRVVTLAQSSRRSLGRSARWSTQVYPEIFDAVVHLSIYGMSRMAYACLQPLAAKRSAKHPLRQPVVAVVDS